MGVVYLARQVNLNRQLAVKMILRGPLASQGDRDRFLAEAQAAARLDHPGIVPVYQVGEDAGRMYFSMKYIKGPTLSDLLNDGPLDPQQAARLLAKVSRAIDFAHQHGVLHRDLKPSNILIDEDGEPHVTDFGLAKRITDPHSMTHSGAVVGTPAYMSPEQAAGSSGSVGPASDVYSLGAILYHMLTGVPPFQAASPVDTVMKVIEQDPVPPRQRNREVDRDLEIIAVRCLQKPTDLRYASARSLGGRPGSVSEPRADRRPQRPFDPGGVALVSRNAPCHRAGELGPAVDVAQPGPAGRLPADQHPVLVPASTIAGTTSTSGRPASAPGPSSSGCCGTGKGPVTFVERQIAHVWAAALLCIIALFPLEAYLGLPPLKLSPVLGLIAGMVFLVKAGILSGLFYIQAAALFLTAGLMAVLTSYEHLIFGIVSAACFFFPGLKYYRQQSGKSEVERGQTSRQPDGVPSRRGAGRSRRQKITVAASVGCDPHADQQQIVAQRTEPKPLPLLIDQYQTPGAVRQC